MTLNLQLEDDLIKDAMRLGRHRSREAMMEKAVREYVRIKKQMKIFDLAGKVVFYDTVNGRPNGLHTRR